MPTEIKAQNTTTLASVKAIYDAADQANSLLDDMQAAATAAGTTLEDIYQDAADAATAADNAQQAADTALVNLATTENVVGVLNWITAHGTMTLTSDVTVNPAHVYFVVDPAGDYVVGGTHYSVVAEPTDDDIATYYELSVDESVQNYVATHIVVDTEGLWIVPDAGGNKVLIATGSGSTYTTAGTYIVGKVGGVDTVLSSFTAGGITIGKEYEFGANNESHLIINNNSMQLVDKTGEPYVYISEVDSEPFTSGNSFSNTTSQVFTVSYPINTVNSVKVNGVSAGYTITGSRTVTLTSAPLSPSTVDISYTTTSFGKRYTLGYRKEGTTIGDMSFAEGMNVEASGKYSHAEGNGSRATGAVSHAENDAIASGSYSHAEGASTKSSGNYSHAEGVNSESSGDYSHAQNYDTIAASDSQTALGKYNVADSADTYACIIGNGTSDNARSNALTVDWSGNVMSQGMAGMIQMFAGSTAPTGWLICDGSAVSRTTYATLFSVIGTSYGTGDGSTTFNLPDMRGKFPLGVSSSHPITGTGSSGGAETVTLTTNEMPSHHHDVTYAQYNRGTGSSTTSALQYTGYTKQTSDTGGGQAHENMPPYRTVNFIIATGKTA